MGIQLFDRIDDVEYPKHVLYLPHKVRTRLFWVRCQRQGGLHRLGTLSPLFQSWLQTVGQGERARSQLESRATVEKKAPSKVDCMPMMVPHELQWLFCPTSKHPLLSKPSPFRQRTTAIQAITTTEIPVLDVLLCRLRLIIDQPEGSTQAHGQSCLARSRAPPSCLPPPEARKTLRRSFPASAQVPQH